MGDTKARRAGRPWRVPWKLVLFALCVFQQWISFHHIATLPRLENDTIAWGPVPRAARESLLRAEGGAPASAAVPMPEADFGYPDSLVGPEFFRFPQPYERDNPMKRMIASSDYRLSVALDLAGCEPKMELVYGASRASNNDSNHTGTRYIFKIAGSPGSALNELIAFHVDRMFGFHRVPPVAPFEMPLSEIVPEITRAERSRNQNLWTCNMAFSETAARRWVTKNSTRAASGDTKRFLRPGHEKDADVFGTLQLRVPGVRQRSELVRFVDHLLTESEFVPEDLSRNKTSGNETRAKRRDPPPPTPKTNATDRSILGGAAVYARSMLRSTLFGEDSVSVQREKGTRALFDFLIGNGDRFNNDFVIPQKDAKEPDEPERQVLVYIDNSLLNKRRDAFDLEEWTRDCRFYRRPVDRLFNVSNPRNVLMYRLKSHHKGLVDRWMYQRVSQGKPIKFKWIGFFKNLEKRMKIVRRRVEECLAARGAHYVFVER